MCNKLERWDAVGLRMQLSGDCVKVIARHSPLTIALSCLLTLQIKDDGDDDDDGDSITAMLIVMAMVMVTAMPRW